MKNLPKIYFYISRLKNIPSELLSSNDLIKYKLGFGISDAEYCHVIQTFFELKKKSFPCELTDVMPEDGIVIVHADSHSFDFKPGKKLLVIYLRADKPPHVYPQITIVPNKFLKNKEWTFRLWKNYYIPHWVQPGLIPRENSRGDVFKNIAYIGGRGNLCAELKSKDFEDQLKELSLSWSVPPREKWHDFREIDAIIAVRTFKSLNRYIINKTPQKLFNAWAAGVPAILGVEQSYRSERRNALDYIEVRTIEETIDAVKLLRDDVALRHKMVENGKISAQEFSSEIIFNKWREFLLEIAIPEYYKWCTMSNFKRNLWYKSRKLVSKLNFSFNKIMKKSYVDSSWPIERRQ